MLGVRAGVALLPAEEGWECNPYPRIIATILICHDLQVVDWGKKQLGLRSMILGG